MEIIMVKWLQYQTKQLKIIHLKQNTCLSGRRYQTSLAKSDFVLTEDENQKIQPQFHLRKGDVTAEATVTELKPGLHIEKGIINGEITYYKYEKGKKVVVSEAEKAAAEEKLKVKEWQVGFEKGQDGRYNAYNTEGEYYKENRNRLKMVLGDNRNTSCKS